MTAKSERPLIEEALTRSVIGVFYDVHRALGFGFREYIYALALERDLMAKGHRVDREATAIVYYRGEPLARQSLDILVDEKLVLEIKATERLHPDATTQLFSYLCATNLQAGLLLHFGREAKVHRVIYENRFKRHQFASNTVVSQ
ncbi:MAG TPA: GxxExxY protein [Gemmatimonadaceae bacterium]|jgi:GxxExxY protein